ncbi:MAG: hypothetical protein GAK29_05049 [Acinetobacter bereziniae]|uniref:Uncharacterized protein n=1 Tax=Acinetobacter bereziniae TaxID=106648 RepID=A0A833TT88_ACIBZ|nr:MAG: hypothetical protein GAK29_05049 [Acinetobacter bereziniae]
MLRVGAWNVRGLNEKENEVLDEMERMKLDMMCVCETKRKGKACMEMNDYNCGQE